MFKALGLLYVRPFLAIGLILDRGTAWTAVAIALLTTFALAMPGLVATRRVVSSTLQGFEYAQQHRVAQNAPPEEEDDFDASVQPPASTIAYYWASAALGEPFRWLGLLALVLVPSIVVMTAKLEGTGSPAMALRRDYMPALVCHLMAWSAAMLPVAAAQWTISLRYAVSFAGMAVWALALGFFAFLSVASMRAISGTGFGRAAGALGGGALCSAAGFLLYSQMGFLPYFFLSPCVAIYLYRSIGWEVQMLGGGLSSRQRFRQFLEASTVNPRDADAHYQLGLIYQQRHDYAQAKPRFERAIEIDPSDADPHFQLGRILREEGQPAPALERLKAAAAIDPKHASNEVQREIGAALLEMGRHPEARPILADYADRRPFDPEGQYWFGVALEKCGETAAARQAWQSAIEAVRTAPSHRRRHLGRWESLAAKQLRGLGR